MRAFLLLPMFLLGGSLIAGTGGRFEYKDQNFSIALPDGWTQFDSPSRQVLLAAKDAKSQQFLLLGAAKLPENQRATGAATIREGIKKGYISTHATIDSEESTKIGDIPFLVLKAHNGPTNQATAYTTEAGDQAYAIQLISKGAADDSDQQFIIQSFRLLNPATFQVASAPEPSAAYKAGRAFGWLIGVGVVITVVFLTVAGVILLIIFLARRTGKKR